MEHLDIIAKQKSELEQLRRQLNTDKAQDFEQQHKKTLAELEAKESQLENNKKELDKLKETLDSLQQENQTAQLLAEKDKLIKKKEEEIESLQSQYEHERAELVKPALAQVTSQLDELKETVSFHLSITLVDFLFFFFVKNKVVMERLGEKENELVELRSQLNRRERKPKSGVSKDQEQQNRLNRLTMDLENDRILVQKLEELNHQLEVTKLKKKID